MSYAILKEGLNQIDKITKWSLFLIHYNHKTHPNEYTCYPLYFEPVNLINTVVSRQKTTFEKNIEAFDEKVIKYTGFNSKGVIDKIDMSDELINTQWAALLRHIQDHDDSKKIDEIKAGAYIFVGIYKNDDGEDSNLYLLTKRNPIVNLNKSKRSVFVSRLNTLAEVTEPMVQFGSCFDAIIYSNAIYMINSNCESVFNLEYSHKKICQKHLNELETMDMIEDFDEYVSYANKGQTPKKFISYSSQVVNYLKKPTSREKFAKIFGIPYDKKNKKFDLSNPQNAKNFTLGICGKAKRELTEDSLCEVPMSMPLKTS